MIFVILCPGSAGTERDTSVIQGIKPGFDSRRKGLGIRLTDMTGIHIFRAKLT